MAITPSPFRT